MKLLIRNLARSTTEAEIREIFEPYGAVQSCTLVMDKETGQSKGFGFVEMPKSGDAKAAMKNLNGEELDGNKIRVKKAESKRDRDDVGGRTTLVDKVKKVKTRVVNIEYNNCLEIAARTICPLLD